MIMVMMRMTNANDVEDDGNGDDGKINDGR